MQYDIFISYKRRGTSSATAAYIYDLLTKKGYSVFFDRKEIRQGSFDTQLLAHIENAKDIFVLLEDSSLDVCFKGADDNEAYKTDWFCMEIMHALKKNKRIIPVLLDGYKMPEMKDLPDELRQLSKQNAIQLDISEIDDFYQKYLIDQQYLASKPRNIFLARQNGDGVSNFLFYCDEDCDIYEFGNLVGRIDQNIDEEHPYIYPVKFAGEHRFKFINNDTCEEQRLSISIEKDKQLYVPIAWKSSQNLWELTDEIIAKQEDSQALYLWGKGLYEGSSKHEPDYERSFKCLERSAQMLCLDAKKFIINKCDDIFDNPKTKDVELQWLEKAAEYDCAAAFFMLGNKYLRRNIDKALFYYEKAAKQNEPQACNDLGVIYFYGKYGVEKDVKKGLDFFRKAAEAGQSLAMVNFGNIYFYGQNGVEKDVEKGLKFYSRAAEAGNSYAMNNLGEIYFYGQNGVENDAQKGLEFFRKAAEAGNSYAMKNLSIIYFYGQNGVEKDVEKGLEFYRKAAEAGDPDAMTNLSTHYFNGEKKDTQKNLEFYRKAAEVGIADAMRNLGYIYFYGKDGVEKDVEKGIEFICKAAEPGDSDTLFLVGDIYFYGKYGVKKDVEKGIEVYHKAAEAGNADAMRNLGNIYFYGKYGMEKDVEKGLEFFRKAAEAGNPDASIALSVIYKKIKGFKNIALSKKYRQKANNLIEESIDPYYEYNKIAWQLHLMQEYKEALPWVQKIPEAYTTDTKYLNTIACVYKGLKRYGDALKYYQKALDLGRTEAAQDIEEVKKLIATSKKKKTKASPKKR